MNKTVMIISESNKIPGGGAFSFDHCSAEYYSMTCGQNLMPGANLVPITDKPCSILHDDVKFESVLEI